LSTHEKYQAFWPLPGGVENYVATLQKALIFIKENRPSEQKLAEWFMASFQTVKSAKNAVSYIRTTLRHSGLVDYDKRVLFLTPAGEAYLGDPDNLSLFSILDENVLGFGEVLRMISESEYDIEQLGEKLPKELSLPWEEAHQTKWRVNWLRSMGLVTLEEGKVRLTETGRQLSKSLPMVPEIKREVSEQVRIADQVKLAVFHNPRVPEIIDKLRETQHLSDESSKFEEAIAQAFALLGFSSEKLGQPGDTDVFVIAHLGDESYKIIIDGKTTHAEKIAERQISWPSLTDHKKRRAADFIAVVAPSFPGGDLIERAQQYGVSLIETETLVKLLKIHDSTPLDLEAFRELFQRRGVVRLEDCSDLMTRQAESERQQRLIPGILESLYGLQRRGEPTHASDVRWELGKQFDQEDILDTLGLLENWGFVKKTSGDNWIALMNPGVASQRLSRLSASFKQTTN
jgi:hypothetical protein